MQNSKNDQEESRDIDFDDIPMHEIMELLQEAIINLDREDQNIEEVIMNNVFLREL